MDRQKVKHRRQLRRRRHVRSKIVGTAERPRLNVFRSNKHIYAQLIDDLNGATLATASSSGKEAGLAYGGNTKAAAEVGKKLAEAAKAKGITKAAFDRGHYRFHGRIKALAVAANAAGLECCHSRKPPKEPVAAAPAPEKGKEKEKKEKKPKPEGKPEKKPAKE